ncbi:MAG: hypothetical protein WD207_01270 [Xanthobacteraceae bacterium]
MSRSTTFEVCVLLRGVLAAVFLLSAGPAKAQKAAEAAVNPFEGMAGAWSGNGSITLGSGDKERIRCRVTYVVNDAGTRVEQDLRCASDSYKFELLTDINYANGFVTGRWNERTQRSSGTISGRAGVGQIEALAETSGFSAFFTMITRGDRQSVRIESKSPEISDVTITLRRSGK